MKNLLKYFFIFFILAFITQTKAQKNLTIKNLSKQQTFYINIYTATDDGWKKINEGKEEITPQQITTILGDKNILENDLGVTVWTNKEDCLKGNRHAAKFSIDIENPAELNPLQINISDNQAYFGKEKELEIKKEEKEKETEVDLKLHKAFSVDLPRIYQEQVPKLQLKKYKYDPDILGNPKIDEIKTLNDLYKETEDEEFQEAQRYIKSIRLRAIALGEGFTAIDKPSYGDWIVIYIPDVAATEPPYRSIKDFHDFIQKLKKESSKKIAREETIINELVQRYKIHLMPKGIDLEKITIKFLQAYKKDPELKNAISSLKISPSTEKELIEEGFARIVIYPRLGKTVAQKVLNKLYEIFKNDGGSNITPRFNQKITSLIYWAQGDRDDKELEKYAQYYEQPNKICYKKNIKQMINPKAPEEDYYLKNPSINKSQ